MIKTGSTKLLPSTLLYDLGRIVLAVILLAFTAIAYWPVAVKSIFAILSILILIVHRHKTEGFTKLEIGMVCFAVAIGTIAVCSKSFARCKRYSGIRLNSLGEV